MEQGATAHQTQRTQVMTAQEMMMMIMGTTQQIQGAEMEVEIQTVQVHIIQISL